MERTQQEGAPRLRPRRVQAGLRLCAVANPPSDSFRSVTFQGGPGPPVPRQTGFATTAKFKACWSERYNLVKSFRTSDVLYRSLFRSLRSFCRSFCPVATDLLCGKSKRFSQHLAVFLFVLSAGIWSAFQVPAVPGSHPWRL